MDSVVKQLKQYGEVSENTPIKPYTSMRVGGNVRAIFTPTDLYGLIDSLKLVKKARVAYKVLGRGSNCVFSSNDMDLIIIRVNNVVDELIIDEEYITVGAGYSMQKLAKVLSKKGFMGLEFAGGIPGTVGGAIYMNAGAHQHEISDLVIDVTYLDENDELKTIELDECDFGYRSSIFQKKDMLIVSCKLRIILGDKAQVFKKMSGNLEYRKEMQPLEYPSCGSTFRNPPGEHAGKLIDECGLKGYRIGGVCVSEKHANFIINDQDGTGEDVYRLVQYVKDEVFKQTSIMLHEEMEFINIK